MSWPLVCLSDVAEINPRCPKEIDETQTVSFVAMASVSEEGNLLNEEPRTLGDTKKGFTYFQRSDVLLAKITPCFENGKSLKPNSISHDVGFGSTEFHVLRAKEEVLDPSYLFYMVWSKAFRFLGEHAMSGAAGQRRVGAEFLKKHNIPLPPLAEQKRIAAILDKADAIRQKRKQAIDLADEFLRSVFLDMFGDPVTNPKGWEKQKLSEAIVDGPTNGLYKPSTKYGKGTRILRIDGFYNGELRTQSLLKRVETDEVERNKFGLKDRSIVINRVNSPEYLGKCAFVSELEEETVFESNMMNFSVSEHHLNPVFLTQQLQMPNIKQQIMTGAKHAVNQSSINQQDVKGFVILMPPIELQNKYELLVKEFKARSIKAVDQSEEMDSMFHSLSQKAFSSEL
ncbi:restriction endonuclease subunit S [Shewanella sp. WPAGA9]|uniref:restriction endonuclease subunit S n=1 Tax=Shewanella sp. ENK2 TaxID=2775245 RepID=UPI00177B1BFA|nr:restriction endonuclease subunit S [Shewanella sp. WPAGA9]